MKFGYARVSTQDQNLDLQIASLKASGAEKIFEDRASGKKMDRTGLQNALSHLRAGDTLIVWKLDRLGRSVKGLVELVEDLQQKEIGFVSITDSIDTSTPSGRFFFHMMAALAQMERELIVERTRAGLNAARQRGRVGGRPRAMTKGKLESAQTLLDSGVPPRDVADQLGVSIPTLYRWLPAGSR